MTTDGLLVINAGSSSLKFSLYAEQDDGLTALYHGKVENIGHDPEFSASGPDGAAVDEQVMEGDEADHAAVLERILRWLDSRAGDVRIRAAGHRVVHGGAKYRTAVRITEEVRKDLDAFIPLAPLHQPHNLAPVDALWRRHPELPQVACFDTAFHRTQPEVAQRFAIPRALTQEGVRRYGFHGLSYEYIAGVLPDTAGPYADGRVVVAHLGHGASMCAMKERKSVATTMGFTALDGLPMASRSGNLDPGVVLYLLQEKGMSADEVAELLYHDCGLYGVSGISAHMEDLLASRAPEAEEAVELFCYRASRELGSLAAALGGLDVLVFTAGIGEHAPEVRRRIGLHAHWLGVELDDRANRRNAATISTIESRVSVHVIPTDEEWTIARHTRSLWG